MSRNAFEITPDDVESVLQAYSLRVANTGGRAFSDLAEELFDEMDHERIQDAALAGSTDLDGQTQAAFDEIKNSLVELGVIDF